MSLPYRIIKALARRKSAASVSSAPTSLVAQIEPPNAPSREELIATVKSFPYWYQRIYLGQGVYSLPEVAYHEQVWRRMTAAFPANLAGASVLDVGANAGYFSIQAKLLNAGRVVGIESIDDYLKQAEFCRRVWNFDIKYLALDAHQINQIQEQFDLVVFTGILYHLKNPLMVLEEVGRVCRDAVLIETEVISEDPRNVVYTRLGPWGKAKVTACHKGVMKFIEAYELNGDGSNWWVPDTECVLGMLRVAGFKYFSAPVYFSDNRLALIASKQRDSILNLSAFK